MSKVASLVLYFAFSRQWHGTSKKTRPSAGRKSEGLNSATYEIVALGYMKKTGGEIE
jgi:hypothetical protein